MTTASSLPDHDIAVVIMNYNSADMSLAAIESVLAETVDMTGVHIHLVDNASPNGDAEALMSVCWYVIASRALPQGYFLHSRFLPDFHL